MTLQNKIKTSIETTLDEIVRDIEYLSELMQNEKIKQKIELVFQDQLKALRYWGLQI